MNKFHLPCLLLPHISYKKSKRFKVSNTNSICRRKKNNRNLRIWVLFSDRMCLDLAFVDGFTELEEKVGFKSCYQKRQLRQ